MVFLAEPWELKDTLRQMTLKFNDVVTELNTLRTSSTEINQSTQNALKDIVTQIEEITSDLNTKISEVNAQDIGLGNVDNTSDMDKPVSTLQAQAIQKASEAISQELLSTQTEDIVTTDESGEPIINPVLKSLIRDIVVEVCANEGQSAYGIATDLTLGVVKSSTDVKVDNATGKMSIPKLEELTTCINTLENHADVLQNLSTNQGDLQKLQTNSKSSLVDAINEVFKILNNVNVEV